MTGARLEKVTIKESFKAKHEAFTPLNISHDCSLRFANKSKLGTNT